MILRLILGSKEPNPAWSAAAAGATTGAMAPKMIYVMGGVPGFAPPFDQNYAYNPKEDGWIIAASLPAPKSSFAVAVVNDLVYVIGGTTVNYGVITASVEQYTPIGYETSDPSYDGTAPEIAVLSPENKTYYTANVTLSFTVNEPVSSMHYELDGETAVEISGNTTIARLAIGVHNITVSAVDAAGNMGVSETVTFTIAKETEAFPIRLAAAAAIVIAAIVLVAAVSIGLSVYLKKRK